MNPAFGYSYTNFSCSDQKPPFTIPSHPAEVKNEAGVVGSVKPAQIHVNPKMCAPRNIYINKAFSVPPNPISPKPERVYYNPKFLKNNTNSLNGATNLKVRPTQKEPSIHINPNFIKNGINKINSLTPNSKNNEPPDISILQSQPSRVGIHINPAFLQNMTDNKTETQTTHSLNERLAPTILPDLTNVTKPKFVSKYKLVRKKSNLIFSNNAPHLRRVKNSQYKKINNPLVRKKKIKIVRGKYLTYRNPNLAQQKKCKVPVFSEFKFIGLNKLVRKSVLQKQIESRMCARKYSKTAVVPGAQKISSPRKSGDKISKYKIIRSTSEASSNKKQTSNKTTNLKKKTIKRKRSSLKFSSKKYRSEKRKKVAALTKKLRKNNQPCPFYSRFGHCKGKEKGTCQKLHDPKYIAICKRFVKGECKDEKCTLSHDVRPEKMPTCHHYLAGLCKRTDCPYLHIRVNPKAPICRAFLQGFCADVFNCTKRHEYLCPAFAEKGACPREKTCPYAHRPTVSLSKLLQPDEYPLVNRKVSIPKPTLSSPPPAKPKEFKRYFLTSLSDTENESPNDDNEDS